MSDGMKNNSMKTTILLLALLLAGGCQGPLLTLGGGRLAGEEAVTDNWSVARGHTILQLETRPANPYSVNLRVVLIDDQLYLDAARQRRWHEHVRADPRVRVRLGKTIYRARAVPVRDPDLARRFLPGRTVYRLEPDAWTPEEPGSGSNTRRAGQRPCQLGARFSAKARGPSTASSLNWRRRSDS